MTVADALTSHRVPHACGFFFSADGAFALDIQFIRFAVRKPILYATSPVAAVNVATLLCCPVCGVSSAVDFVCRNTQSGGTVVQSLVTEAPLSSARIQAAPAKLTMHHAQQRFVGRQVSCLRLARPADMPNQRTWSNQHWQHKSIWSWTVVAGLASADQHCGDWPRERRLTTENGTAASLRANSSKSNALGGKVANPLPLAAPASALCQVCRKPASAGEVTELHELRSIVQFHLL